MIALVDCNSFYANCERLFRPDLRGKPVVVLSNNDGCVVSLSDEAKAAGVPMGVPFHEIRDLVRRRGIAVFSSNYALYGDLSARVTQVLRVHAPYLETYSIDESFVDIAGIPDPAAWGRLVRSEILRQVGIPVCVGIGRTRTLSKVANRVAKKFKERTGGVHLLDTPEREEKAMRWLALEDVWGIGAASARKLALCGARTAWDMASMPQGQVRRTLGVVGERTWQELRGVPTQGLCEEEPVRRSLRTTRSFESPLTEIAAVEEAVATFATRTARKLRERSLCAGALSVYLRSDRFSGERFHESRTAGFAVATGDAREVAGMALRLVREMFREGSPVKKAGVEAWDLVPEGAVQGHLFDAVDRPRQASLQRAVDGLVRRWGSDVLELAVQGGGKSWSTRQEHRSRRYTTDWNELLVVDMDRSHRIAPAAG